MDPQNGFSATVTQFAWAAGPRQQPRRVEALSPGARAELERSVREELRRALEDRRARRDRRRGAPRRGATPAPRDRDPGARQFLSEMGPVEERRRSHRWRCLPFPRASKAPARSGKQRAIVGGAGGLPRRGARAPATITDGIRALERSPGDLEAINAIRRATHTLKGAAGMMGFTAIQTISHDSEDLLERLADGRIAFDASVMRLILDTSDALDQLISRRANRPEDQQALVRTLNDRYASLTGGSLSRKMAQLASQRLRVRQWREGSSRANSASVPSSEAPTRVEPAVTDRTEVKRSPI